ncbi:MAG: DEAD/DEAH box helicase [Thermoproteota archaeon]|jgi:ATP-dependent Lhr-like helicase|nr:DEAD/DEAH box helicase [Candidatus Nitrosopelagicus sp.]MEC9436608.1 DEAD/DEAH box helicase [Thermoproteota archaeon]GIT55663.1 MAG: helicase [Candidatus Nitrosopelagicus sp.]
MNELELDKKNNKILDPTISKKFKSIGFEELTEIQKEAIPEILEEKNCLIIAPTGSGKTECATIPIFSKLKTRKVSNKIKALYITPLRALNRDVFKRIINYAENENLKIEIRHGDTSQANRKRIADNPPDILITTPETLVNLLSQKKHLDALSDLEWVIIDEVHELLASERGSQLCLSLERLQIKSKNQIHRIGLSATVGNPEEAGRFLVGTDRKFQLIHDTSLRNYDVDVVFVDGIMDDVAVKIIEYIKKEQITSPVLLFTNSRGESERLSSILKQKTSINVELHHGSLSRQVREETEDMLRDGKSGIVVCTSSLELGLDIGSVELVIHYGSPRQVSKFMQRIGRSKHDRGDSARGLIITENADDEFEIQAIIERIKEGSIEEQKIHHGSLDVLAHHLVGLSMQVGNVPIEAALKLTKLAYPFRDISLEEFFDVLEILALRDLIIFNDDKTEYKKNTAFFATKYHFQNLSTIPDILKFKVVDTIENKFIGTLDQRFVGDLDKDQIFVLRGSQWRVLNIDEKSFKINVLPIRSSQEIPVPKWEGVNIPVDFKTANKVGAFRTKVRNGSLKMMNNIISNLDFPKVPDEKTIVIESHRLPQKSVLILHSCFGTKINSTLKVILETLLDASLASRVKSSSDAYRILLSVESRFTKKHITDVFLSDFDINEIMSVALKGKNDVTWKTFCVGKKFGFYDRSDVYVKNEIRYDFERNIDTPLVKEAFRELFHEKFDLEGAQRIIDLIKENKIQIEWVDVDKFSKLAEPVLDQTVMSYTNPANIDKEMLLKVKTRLMQTKQRLICVRCGLWQQVMTPNETHPLRCKYCKGQQITCTYEYDHELVKIIQKKHQGKKLTPDENKNFQKAWKVSSLLSSFGKTALIVMAAYGVGPDTGARILKNRVEGDDDYLIKQIIIAEKTYTLTRGFWKD